MAGTIEGGRKAREKNLASDPDFYKKVGRIGGLKGKGPGYQGGFAHPSADPKSAGSRGGKISRRSKRLNITGAHAAPTDED